MKYIFMDIEWASWTENSQNHFELLQIATSIRTESLDEIKKVYRVIRPAHADQVSPATLKLMNLNQIVLSQAKTEAEILPNIMADIHRSDILVFWGSESLDKFLQILKANALTPKTHKYLLLSELMKERVGRYLSFEDSLTSLGIPFEENLLHCSKHDVSYLVQLFSHLEQKYLQTNTANLVFSRSSGIIHQEGCYYASRIADSNLREATPSQLFQQHALCKYCQRSYAFPKIEIKSYKKLKEKEKKAKNSAANAAKKNGKKSKNTSSKYAFVLPPEEEQFYDDVVQMLCDHYELECSISEGLIFIRTAASHWRIYHDYEKVKRVMHENYHKGYNVNYQFRKASEGYHEQVLDKSSLAAVLRYIASHDKSFLKGKTFKKTRLDYLFDQIEKQRHHA